MIPWRATGEERRQALVLASFPPPLHARQSFSLPAIANVHSSRRLPSGGRCMPHEEGARLPQTRALKHSWHPGLPPLAARKRFWEVEGIAWGPRLDRVIVILMRPLL